MTGPQASPPSSSHPCGFPINLLHTPHPSLIHGSCISRLTSTLMTDAPPSKRPRFTHHGAASDDLLSPFLPTPTTESQPGAAGNGLNNIDPFLSPATSWGIDEFSLDPSYLASQEELRSLLFTTARSTAPTRAGTPVGAEESGSGATFNIKQVLAKGRRVQYLKNYISHVAPWVGPLKHVSLRSGC